MRTGPRRWVLRAASIGLGSCLAVLPTLVARADDPGAPDTSITSAPAAFTQSTSATITFTGSDDVTPANQLTFECSLDDAPPTACSSPLLLTGLAESPHNVAVAAIDQSGHHDATPATATWTVDTHAPFTDVFASVGVWTQATSATFNIEAHDYNFVLGELTFECSFEGAAFAPCATPVTFNDLPEGVHTFAARAIDQAGNIDSDPASWTWRVDHTPPDTVLLHKPKPYIKTTTAKFSYGALDHRDGLDWLLKFTLFECTLDGNYIGHCPTIFRDLAEGPHSLAVVGWDESANRDPTPASYTWVVDTIKPTLSLTASGTSACGDANLFQNQAVISTNVSEPNTTVHYQLNGGGSHTATGPLVITTLGTTTVSVWVVDPAGNKSDTSTITVRVTDIATAPVVEAFNRPDGPLGATWSNATGYQIVGGRAVPTTGGVALLTGAGPYGTDQQVGVTLSTIDPTSTTVGVMLKGSLDPTGLRGLGVAWDATTRALRVSSFRSGVISTTYAAGVRSFAAGDRLSARLKVDGTVVIYRNCDVVGLLKLNSSDKSFFRTKTGSAALWSNASTTTKLDDLTALTR